MAELVAKEEEVKYYHELGLGRGVNVTHPDMWKTKTSCLVRQVCPSLKNIIGTQECGIRECYEKEVSTFSSHQQKLRLSLDSPAAPVKLGMDEQYSRSSSATKLIKGEKIETRTISFKTHFDEVPLYSTIDTATIDPPTSFLPAESDYSFEEDMASWFLKRMDDREKKAISNDNTIESEIKSSSFSSESTEKTPHAQVKQLAARLKGLAVESEKKPTTCLEWQEQMLEDCKTLVEYLDITHYVSAIKLGACCFHEVSTKTEQKAIGAGTTVTAASLAKGGLSGHFSKQFASRFEQKQEIGRMKDERVLSEAVIGFEIQPLYKLMRIQYIQMLLRKAVMDYIRNKEDASKGPYLISTEVGKNPVFWKVNENHQLTATVNVTDASLFYIVSTADATHPSEFHIAYWIRDKQSGVHVDNLYRTYNELGPPLPHYLSTDTNLLGQAKGDSPLTVKTTVKAKQARFCLYSRVQSSSYVCICSSTPVTLDSWYEGEQFFLKCSQHSFFKLDGYIAIVENCQQQPQEDQQSRYKVTVVSSTSRRNPAEVGLLFRLHPKGTLKFHEDKAKKERLSPVKLYLHV